MVKIRSMKMGAFQLRQLSVAVFMCKAMLHREHNSGKELTLPCRKRILGAFQRKMEPSFAARVI